MNQLLNDNNLKKFYKIIKDLEKKQDCSYEDTEPPYSLVFIEAIKRGFEKIVKYLAEEKEKEISEVKDQALAIAICWHRLKICRYLLKKGYPLNSLAYYQAVGNNPPNFNILEMIFNKKKPNIAILNYMLIVSIGSPINPVKKVIQLIEYLIEKGADIYHKNDSCLLFAIEKQSYELAKYLIEVYQTKVSDYMINTPFYHGLKDTQNYFKIKKYLIQKRNEQFNQSLTGKKNQTAI